MHIWHPALQVSPWVIKILGDTVSVRHPRFPNYRLDLTKTEAGDLSNELALALNSPIATPFKPHWTLRLHDWWLLLWTKKQKKSLTKEEAQRMLSGGWRPPTDKAFREGFYE